MCLRENMDFSRVEKRHRDKQVTYMFKGECGLKERAHKRI